MNPAEPSAAIKQPGDGPASLESVLCTEELHRRPSRPPDYQTENRALAALAQALADSPRTILQKMAEIMLETFRADSAGFSLLSKDDGGKRFFWPAIAGVWKPHIGGGTPREFGPCGDVLDRNTPLLFTHFERRYDYFLPVTPAVEECLLVPFYVEGKAVGTIWAIAHNDRRKFDAEDLRQLVSLGRFASSAYQAEAFLGTSLDSRHAALNLMEDAVHSREVAEALNVELQRHAAQFETLLDAVPLGVYLVDADLRFRHVSAASVQLFGDIPDLIGRDFDEVIHRLWPPAYADEVVRLYRRTLETGEPYIRPQLIAERIDRGVAEMYEWQINRIPLPEGRYGVVCYFREISDRVRAEQQIQSLLTELQDANRRKDEFLAMLAHELRGPLAPLSNALEIMQRTEGNTDLLPQLRATMQRQMTQMVRLVDDLLDVSRISRNLLELRKERVELAPILQQALEVCRVGLDRARHQITLNLPPEPVVLYADRARLIQAFSNLLNNACKYTDPGGRIELRAELVGSDVLVRVKDNGIGIPADMLVNVFDMFTQVDRTMGRAQGGLGIGLTLVRRLIELHDGTVQVSSAGSRQGAEFVVRLPVVTSGPLLAPPTPADEPVVITPLRILVVDDNHDSASSLATLLRIDGHQTQIAHDGLEAFTAAAMFRPRVVVLDIGMPALNGLDACRHIRAQAWGKDMLLLALSGWGQEEDRRKSLDAGFDAHLVKPLDYAALTRLLAGVSSEP